MMAGSHLAILSEGLALAAKAGIDPDKAVELIKVGPTASPIVLGKMNKVAGRAYDDVEFYLSLLHKDFGYAERLGEGAGVKLRVAPAVRQIIGRAVEKGFGDKDMAAIREGAGD